MRGFAGDDGLVHLSYWSLSIQSIPLGSALFPCSAAWYSLSVPTEDSISGEEPSPRDGLKPPVSMRVDAADLPSEPTHPIGSQSHRMIGRECSGSCRPNNCLRASGVGRYVGAMVHYFPMQRPSSEHTDSKGDGVQIKLGPDHEVHQATDIEPRADSFCWSGLGKDPHTVSRAGSLCPFVTRQSLYL